MFGFDRLNLLSVVVYFFCVVLVVLVKKNKTNNFDSFSKGTHVQQKGTFVFIATIFVSSIGGGTILGLSEKIHSGSIFYSYAAILAIVVDVLIAKYIVKHLSKNFYKFHTIGEIFASCYGTEGKFLGGLSSSVISLGLVAVQLNVSGKVFEYILGIDNFYGIFLTLGIVLLYTGSGGISSILVSNKIQFFAIIISIPLLSVFSVKQIDYSFLTSVFKGSLENNVTSVFLIFMNFIFMNLFPNFVQRVTLSEDYKIIKNAIYIKSIIYFLLLLMIILNGIVSIKLFPEVESKFVFASLIKNLIPTYLQPIIVIGICASIISTMDSDINISSITFVKDVLQLFFRRIDDSNLFYFIKIANFLLGIIAAFLAVKFTFVIDLVIFISGFWGAVILPSFVFLIFGIVIDKRFFISFSFLGFIVFVLYEIFFPSNLVRGVFFGGVTNFLLFTFYVLVRKCHSK